MSIEQKDIVTHLQRAMRLQQMKENMESCKSDMGEPHSVQSIAQIERSAQRTASQRAAEEARERHCELARKAGVAPTLYESVWQQAARLLGTEGCTKSAYLKRGVEKFCVMQKEDGSGCVIVSIMVVDGKDRPYRVSAVRESLDALTKEFEVRNAQNHDLFDKPAGGAS